MIFGANTSRGPNMTDRPLPIRVDPCEGECLQSLLMRTAEVFGVTTDSLVQRCLGPERAQTPPDLLTIKPDNAALDRLSTCLRIPASHLKTLSLRDRFPSIDDQSIAYESVAVDLDTHKEIPNDRLRFCWCPLCLIEDRAGGADHYLRLVWSIATTTLCPAHGRPLMELCHHCYRFVGTPAYALYGKQMALVCPACCTPLDGRLGYDGVSDRQAAEWNGDSQLGRIWQTLGRYEQYCQSILKLRSIRSKKKRIFTEILSVLNLLTRAEKPNNLRPMDLLESAYFPAHPKLGYRTRHLKQPFRACHLVERRKALAILICLLEDSFAAFGFEPQQRPRLEFRQLMHRDNYERFQRHFLNIARFALPI